MYIYIYTCIHIYIFTYTKKTTYIFTFWHLAYLHILFSYIQKYNARVKGAQKCDQKPRSREAEKPPDKSRSREANE